MFQNYVALVLCGLLAASTPLTFLGLAVAVIFYKRRPFFSSLWGSVRNKGELFHS